MKELEFTGEEFIPEKMPYISYEEYQLHILRYVFAANFVKDKTVLDIACGTGYGTHYLSKKGAKLIIGCDIKGEYIEYAKYHYKMKNLSFYRCDALCLPFQDEFFDVVISFETIEHIKEYRGYLSECKRVLKSKEGLFICSTPNKYVYSPHSDVSVPFHFQEFYPEQFYDLIKECFGNVIPYAQLFLTLGRRIKIKLNKIRDKVFHLGTIISSLIPYGEKIREFSKRKLLKYPFPVDAKFGPEILEDQIAMFSEKYEVVFYKNNLLFRPHRLIAISKKID